ncbi:MAG: glycosyltransferase [Ktedonobacterales bacterium]|nr:glycosyltransferase [Ktedonobacterales bacterium]
MTVAPRVSIIIPTYNRAHLVGDAIRGALAQTYRESEVLVIDDGSTDETPALAASFGGAIHAIRQSNAGVEAARNRGATEATGDYLYFLDSDDVPQPNAAQTLVALAEAQPEVGLTYGRAREVDFQGRMIRVYQPGYEHPSGVWPGIRELEHLLLNNYIHPGACLLRRRVWDAVGGFDPACGSAFEDWDLWARVARHAAVGYTPDVLLTVRTQPEGLSQRFGPENYLRNKRQMIDAAFADPAVASQLAPARDRIEGIYLFDVARLAYAVHDVGRARAELRRARARYPGLLADAEAPGARALWLRLKLPQAATDLVRALKHRRGTT